MGDHDRRRRRTRETSEGGSLVQTPEPVQPRGNEAAQQALRETRAPTMDEVVNEVNEAHPDTGPRSSSSAGRREVAALGVHGDGLSATVGGEDYNGDGGTVARQTATGRMRVDASRLAEGDALRSVQVGVNHSDGSGTDRRAVAVSGRAETGRGRAGGSMAGSLGIGRQTYSAGGGRTIEVQAPVQQRDGSFLVSGTVTESGSGGIGSSRALDFGVTGGANTTHTFTEAFSGEDARDQAYAFYLNPRRAAREAGMPTSFEDATELAVGEARGEATGWEVGGEVGAEEFGVSASAGVETGHTEGVAMTRIDEHTLQMTLSYADPTMGTLGLSAAGTGMGYQAGREFRRTTTWTLNLSDEGARQAYAQLQAGQPLEGRSGPGWSRISDQSMQIDTHGATASLFGAALDGAESEQHVVREDERGTVRSDTWRTDAEGISQTAFTRNQYDINDGHHRRDNEADYTVTNTIVRDDLDLSEEALADASNGMDGHATGSAEGTWTVDSSYSEAQIDNFGSAVAEQSRPPGALPPRLHGQWEELQAALRANPSDDAAIGHFLQNTGVDGTRVLQNLTGGPAQQHVHLATESGTDTNFPGRAANDALATQIGQLEQRRMHIEMGGGVPREMMELGDRAATLRAQVRGRLNAITAAGAYPDLPATLVNVEARRLEGWVTRLNSLARAGRRARPDSGEATNPAWAREPEHQAAATLLAEVTGEPVEEVAERDPNETHMALMMELQGNFEALDNRRSDVHYLWDQHHTLHGASSDTPEQRFTGGMTWLTGHGMNDAYSTMHQRMLQADGQFNVAQSNYLRTCEQFDPGVISRGGAGTRDILQTVRNAQGFIRLAKRQYDGVYDGLHGMMLRQRGQNPQVWGQSPG